MAGPISVAASGRLFVLMARIVDEHGRGIDRSHVATIEYSIGERGPGSRDPVRVVIGPDRVPLEVDEVMYDTLQIGSGWDVDAVGFNFRHEFAFERPRCRGRNHFEINYFLRSVFGDVNVIRFQMKGRI